jgi:hypothetical protein
VPTIWRLVYCAIALGRGLVLYPRIYDLGQLWSEPGQRCWIATTRLVGSLRIGAREYGARRRLLDAVRLRRPIAQVAGIDVGRRVERGEKHDEREEKAARAASRHHAGNVRASCPPANTRRIDLRR